MNTKYKSVLVRFAKAFISGALTFMGMVTIFLPHNYEEAKTLIITLAWATLFGGINGVIMAGEKLYNWQE